MTATLIRKMVDAQLHRKVFGRLDTPQALRAAEIIAAFWDHEESFWGYERPAGHEDLNVEVHTGARFEPLSGVQFSDLAFVLVRLSGDATSAKYATYSPLARCVVDSVFDDGDCAQEVLDTFIQGHKALGAPTVCSDQAVSRGQTKLVDALKEGFGPSTRLIEDMFPDVEIALIPSSWVSFTLRPNATEDENACDVDTESYAWVRRDPDKLHANLAAAMGASADAKRIFIPEWVIGRKPLTPTGVHITLLHELAHHLEWEVDAGDVSHGFGFHFCFTALMRRAYGRSEAVQDYMARSMRNYFDEEPVRVTDDITVSAEDAARLAMGLLDALCEDPEALSSFAHIAQAIKCVHAYLDTQDPCIEALTTAQLFDI